MASPIPTTFTADSTPQDSFAAHYNLDNPMESVNSYSRLMHQHTKRQMDLATRSTRRTPADQGVSSMSQLSGEGSVDSVDSLQQ
ncbi:MAG: hypothetical protein ALECFALPRED_001914 [Alectoria fallacina]|uniref:Uncharacterized protein n=1 Tax=Alectoria fallacina TaxID=1903189 RepID=A0A8H3EK28_9LECA|nr:MAG: hypothetical protein ALECFALPRED_001914 [Alectoria fallacina]